MHDILPDILSPDLKVIFCGSAAGRRSAEAGAYYAGPGNRFWPMAYRMGLTPVLFEAQRYRDVLACGIGLTDLAKRKSGADAQIADSAYDPPRLRQAVKSLAPSALAFNGKRPAQLFFGGQVQYGLQRDACGTTRVFVLPSTSGAARRFWDEEPWMELAAWLRTRLPNPGN